MRPRLLITLGDVAGIGPEVLIRAWPELLPLSQPVVVGDGLALRRTVQACGSPLKLQEIFDLDRAAPSPDVLPYLQGTRQDLSSVQVGKVHAAAGQAAFDFLCQAIDHTLAGAAAGIVTLPLHKEGLKAAGLNFPGHTEILADRCGVANFGMMLYARGPLIPRGLGVVHVTLHVALRDVFGLLSRQVVMEKIGLLDRGLRPLCDRPPRLAVAALNPHASDGSLFGDEEETLIAPAVSAAQRDGFNVVGPIPCDTLFVRARQGEFDGVVAMYHDQGHIALKLLSGLHAVNVTLGLPILRTSVAHGTAYDIAGKGIADHGSLIEAVRVAGCLVGR